MSIQVANIDLSAAVVGTTGKIAFGQATPPPTITQQMRPQSSPGYTLLIQNESGAGLTCTFPLTNKSLSIRAGDGRTVHVPPGETELDYTVSYVLPNAPVARLLADLYIPGEAVDSAGNLGNSPIGLASAVSALTTKIPINTVSGDIVGIEFGPDAAFPHGDWEFIVKQTTDYLQLFDNFHGVVHWQARGDVTPVFEIVQRLKLDNAITAVAGQTTAGALGVPADVGQVLSSHITTTGSQTVLTITPNADGLYRINVYLRVNNSVSGQLLSCFVNWTELDTGAATSQNLTANGTPLDGTHSIPNGAYGLGVIPILAKTSGGQDIHITYNDPANVPSDFVSAVIERIA